MVSEVQTGRAVLDGPVSSTLSRSKKAQKVGWLVLLWCLVALIPSYSQAQEPVMRPLGQSPATVKQTVGEVKSFCECPIKAQECSPGGTECQAMTSKQYPTTTDGRLYEIIACKLQDGTCKEYGKTPIPHSEVCGLDRRRLDEGVLCSARKVNVGKCVNARNDETGELECKLETNKISVKCFSSGKFSNPVTTWVEVERDGCSEKGINSCGDAECSFSTGKCDQFGNRLRLNYAEPPESKKCQVQTYKPVQSAISK